MGEPIKFEGCNVVMRAPEGAENVQDMHVYRTLHSCVSCWTLTAEELADINATGRIFLSVLAGGQQPPVYVGSERTCREVMIDFGPVWPTANRAPAPSSLPMSSLKNALQMTGCDDEADLIDMANVGNSLMDRIEQLVACPGPYHQWSPADDPAEIVFDLVNDLDDTREALSKALAALKHARDQIRHPEQLIDEAIEAAEALAATEGSSDEV